MSRAGFVCLAVMMVCHLPVRAADWPHWRGPDRNGVVADASGYNGDGWPAAEAAWSGNVGEGGSSPLVVGGHLFAFGWADGQNSVFCLDAATGKEIWRQAYSCPRYGRHAVGDQGLYSGCSSTPEFDAATGYLYTLSCDGDLHCWDTRQNGKAVWHLNLYDRYGIGRRPQPTQRRNTLRDYGFTSAPLVQGDWVIVEVGDDEGNLMAFDRKTGQRAWASENRDPAGHTGGPVPMTVEGVPCVAVLTIYNLVVTRIDPGHEGKTVAEYKWTTDFANNIATPAVHEDCVLITSAYNKYAICKVRVTLKGAQKVWEQPFPSGVCSPVVHKGHVYYAWRTLNCLDLETGERRWFGTGFGDPGSCIVTADGRIIAWTRRGDLVLAETVERSPARYQELARLSNVFRSEAWPHVVLAGGRVYCKDCSGNINCYSAGMKEAH